MEISKEEFDQQKKDIEEIKEMLRLLLEKPLLNKKYIGVKEAAKYTHLSPSTIYNLRNLEQIPYHKRPGSQKVLFSVAELDEWMTRKKIKDIPAKKKILELL